MRWMLLLAVTVLLVGCGTAGSDGTGGEQGATTPAGETAPDQTQTEDTVPSETTAADGAELTGTLGGDPTLEGGCVWLDTPSGRVQVLWPDGYEATSDPVELVGPEGEVVAAEGEQVTILGAEEADRMSVCQIGPIWTAESVATDDG